MCTETDIAKKRCGTPTSDLCVLYTGPDVPALGIVNDECNGLRLSDIEAKIIERLIAHTNGQNIEISSITANCPFVQDYLNVNDKQLATLIQGLFDANCSLYEYIQTVEAKLEPPFAFDLKCLTTPANPSKSQITQAIINTLCTLKSDFDTLVEDLSDDTDDPDANTIINNIQTTVGNWIAENFTSCSGNLKVTGSGKDTKLNLIGQNPIGTFLHGKFDVSNFDSSGLGLAEKGMCGWAIANGNNGTEDVRGFLLAGTIQGPGGTLNPIVQPGFDASLQAAYLTKTGKNKASLTSSQLPDHQHTINDPGHKHTVHGIIHQDSPDFGNGGAGLDTWFGDISTTTGFTGITIGGVTGTSGQPIDFRQPTAYVRIIQRIS